MGCILECGGVCAMYVGVRICGGDLSTVQYQYQGSHNLLEDNKPYKVVTQYNQRYILSNFTSRGLNKLSNNTQFLKILEIQHLHCMYVFPFIFSIFYTLFCSLSQNKPDRLDVPFVVLDRICSNTFSIIAIVLTVK